MPVSLRGSWFLVSGASPSPPAIRCSTVGRNGCWTTCSPPVASRTRYRGPEVHNKIPNDESVAFATDEKYLESDHDLLVAEFELLNGTN